MVTTYLIEVPCSFCGKKREVKLKGYCSGSCKVKAFRSKGGDKSENISSDFQAWTPKVFTKPEPDRLVPEELEQPQFSDKKKEGFHYSEMLGKYVKD